MASWSCVQSATRPRAPQLRWKLSDTPGGTGFRLRATGLRFRHLRRNRRARSRIRSTSTQTLRQYLARHAPKAPHPDGDLAVSCRRHPSPRRPPPARAIPPETTRRPRFLAALRRHSRASRPPPPGPEVCSFIPQLLSPWLCPCSAPQTTAVLIRHCHLSCLLHHWLCPRLEPDHTRPSPFMVGGCGQAPPRGQKAHQCSRHRGPTRSGGPTTRPTTRKRSRDRWIPGNPARPAGPPAARRNARLARESRASE